MSRGKDGALGSEDLLSSYAGKGGETKALVGGQVQGPKVQLHPLSLLPRPFTLRKCSYEGASCTLGLLANIICRIRGIEAWFLGISAPKTPGTAPQRLPPSPKSHSPRRQSKTEERYLEKELLNHRMGQGGVFLGLTRAVFNKVPRASRNSISGELSTDDVARWEPPSQRTIGSTAHCLGRHRGHKAQENCTSAAPNWGWAHAPLLAQRGSCP